MSTTQDTATLYRRTFDKKHPGVWSRPRRNGSKLWGYVTPDKKFVSVEGGRQEAIDAKARDGLRQSAGLPIIDRKVTISTLVEEVRERQRSRVRSTTLMQDERGLDLIDAHLGKYRPAELIGTTYLDDLVSGLIGGTVTGRPLTVSSAKRYLHVLRHIDKLALKRGLIPVPLHGLIDWPKEQSDVEDEAPLMFQWSHTALDSFLRAAERQGAKATSQYDYSPLWKVIVGTGLRVGEALALKVKDVRLLDARIEVRRTLYRDGTLATPKTAAGRRSVPLSDSLVEILASLVSVDADPESFVFHSKGDSMKPLAYGNVRTRGFNVARDLAGLPESVTIHSLRKALVSFAGAEGISMGDVAGYVGHSDSTVTAQVYERPIADPTTDARLRAVQASLPLERKAA